MKISYKILNTLFSTSIIFCRSKSFTKTLDRILIWVTLSIISIIWQIKEHEMLLNLYWKRSTIILENYASKIANALLVHTRSCKFLLKKLLWQLNLSLQNSKSLLGMIFSYGLKIINLIQTSFNQMKTMWIWMNWIILSTVLT